MITECNVSGNKLDSESATVLAKIGAEKGIMLFGIKRDQKEANFDYRSLGPADIILIASDIVNGSVSECNLRGNNLGVEGWTSIFNALRDSPTSTISAWDLSGENLGPGIATALAEYLSTSTMITECNVSGNKLDSESATVLAKIGVEKGIMLFGIKRDQKEANFANRGLSPVDIILFASDIATGSLTRIDVRGNKITGDGAAQLSAAVLVNLKIEMFNEIPLKEMRADSITELDLKDKEIGDEGGMVVAGLIPAMSVLTRVDMRGNEITGDSAAQLSAAVLGNLKIEMFNKIPLKEMRADSFTELDLEGRDVGVEGGMVVAGLILVMGALTEIK
jgi:hypothetical protein